jgi:hypothetical protein
MKRNILAIVFSTVLAALCAGSLAPAQTGPTGPGGGQPGAGSGSGSGAPSTAPAGQISEQDLEAALKAMDPNLKVRTNQDGAKVYDISVKNGNTTYNVLVLSTANNIFLYTRLSDPITALQNLPAATLAELMKINGNNMTNDGVGPQFVMMQAQGNTGMMLVLVQTLSKQTTSQKLKASIEALVKLATDANPTWSKIKP